MHRGEDDSAPSAYNLIFHDDVPEDTQKVICYFFDLVTYWLILDSDSHVSTEVPLPFMMDAGAIMLTLS